VKGDIIDGFGINQMTPHSVYRLKNYMNRMRCNPIYNFYFYFLKN